MSNKDVINSFLRKEKNKTCLRDIVGYNYIVYKGRTLESTGNILINYNTIIASWNKNGSINVNMKKYSQTTSKIQNDIIRTAKNLNIKVIEKMEDLKIW